MGTHCCYSKLNWKTCFQSWEAVARRCSVKKVFLEISQNSQEKTCVRVHFLNEVAGQWGWIKESEKKAKQAEKELLSGQVVQRMGGVKQRSEKKLTEESEEWEPSTSKRRRSSASDTISYLKEKTGV